jgi:hypothetical protein
MWVLVVLTTSSSDQRKKNAVTHYGLSLRFSDTIETSFSWRSQMGDVTIASVYLQIQTVSLAQITYLPDTMFVLSVNPTAEHKP